MSKPVQSAFIAMFFALLAFNTLSRPFDAWGIQSGPLNLLQSIVDTLLVSWLGSPLAAAVLAALAVALPILSYVGKNRTPAVEAGPAIRSAQSRMQPPKPSQFGKR